MSITDNYTPGIRSGVREAGERAKWIRKCEHATLVGNFVIFMSFQFCLYLSHPGVFFTSFSKQPFPNHETGVFSCWIRPLLTWLFWLNSALKLKMLLHLRSLHLYLFWEVLSKNGSTWDYWDTSTLGQGTRHNTPAQILRRASCPRGGFWLTTRCLPSQGTTQQRNSPERCAQNSSKAVQLLLLMLTF